MELRILLLLLIVVSSSKPSCDVDDDCLSMNECDDGTCEHKSLSPIEPIEIGGALLFLFVSIFANAAGNGGSAIILPLLVLMYNFHTSEIPKFAIVYVGAGSGVVAALVFKTRHPTKDRPVVSYDFLILLLSPILFGIRIGNIIRPSFPS